MWRCHVSHFCYHHFFNNKCFSFSFFFPISASNPLIHGSPTKVKSKKRKRGAHPSSNHRSRATPPHHRSRNRTTVGQCGRKKPTRVMITTPTQPTKASQRETAICRTQANNVKRVQSKVPGLILCRQGDRSFNHRSGEKERPEEGPQRES
jgi:hypothetical protein